MQKRLVKMLILIGQRTTGTTSLRNYVRSLSVKTISEKQSTKSDWEKREEEDRYIMERMHPAVMIPGFFIGFMVIVGCLFKGYMGW
tara:strand:- start:213 stop:470 length:258 start_codon:yes stop_codon:yes gene_type:complete